MKRKTLDVLFSGGLLVLAGLLLAAGLVLSANANFANGYVTGQLSQQNITFKAADTLTDEEKNADCLVTYAGQQLTTGKQAECYAKQLADVTGQRETVFKGETLRGLLLTSYGFSEFGTKAGQAATVAYLAAVLMLLLAIAGFLHALVTPRSKAFAAPDPEPSRIDEMNTGVSADDTHTGASRAPQATRTGHVSNATAYQDAETRT